MAETLGNRVLKVEIPKDATLVTRNEKDGGVALWIPTGKSTMGSRRGNNDEKPEHNVHLDAFYMDVNPITNTQFSKFDDNNQFGTACNIQN